MQTEPTRNQRRARRKRVENTSAVVDVISAQVIGHLGDVSISGLMLVGAHTTQSGAIHQLSLPLSGHHAPPRQIEVGVQAMWQRAGADPRRLWAGYRIIAISDHDAAILREWLDTPS